MNSKENILEEDTIACIGKYDDEDYTCKNCSVRLYCLLEQDNNIRIETIHDYFVSDTLSETEIN